MTLVLDETAADSLGLRLDLWRVPSTSLWQRDPDFFRNFFCEKGVVTKSYQVSKVNQVSNVILIPTKRKTAFGHPERVRSPPHPFPLARSLCNPFSESHRTRTRVCARTHAHAHAGARTPAHARLRVARQSIHQILLSKRKSGFPPGFPSIRRPAPPPAGFPTISAAFPQNPPGAPSRPSGPSCDARPSRPGRRPKRPGGALGARLRRP